MMFPLENSGFVMAGKSRSVSCELEASQSSPCEARASVVSWLGVWTGQHIMILQCNKQCNTLLGERVGAAPWVEVPEDVTASQ